MERAELIALLRATGCAEERNGIWFLCDPAWTETERGEAERAMATPAAAAPDGLGWLCVRTGGSSGGVKFARHDERTLSAAVRGFCEHFGLARVHAVDVLPPHHVSGLMARVRCAATGGRHVPWDWKRLERGETPPLSDGDWVLSLVPTQLQRLLRRESGVGTSLRDVREAQAEGLSRGRLDETCLPVLDWLRRFRVIFIGGGPIWPELAEAAARAGLRLSLSYGMTETAAMVAALRPEEFLAGERSCGAAMPHARIELTPEGTVRIAGESLFRGYWPEWRETRAFTTEDLGEFDARGHLRVLGRRDAMIITGGKKVQPAAVEAALRASGEFEDVAVVGVPDSEWGEVVAACYLKSARSPDFGRAVAGLAPHERPKRFAGIPREHWPRNAQGKLNRDTLRALAAGIPAQATG